LQRRALRDVKEQSTEVHNSTERAIEQKRSDTGVLYQREDRIPEHCEEE
jgi:hypothetical protein